MKEGLGSAMAFRPLGRSLAQSCCDRQAVEAVPKTDIPLQYTRPYSYWLGSVLASSPSVLSFDHSCYHHMKLWMLCPTCHAVNAEPKTTVRTCPTGLCSPACGGVCRDCGQAAVACGQGGSHDAHPASVVAGQVMARALHGRRQVRAGMREVFYSVLVRGLARAIGYPAFGCERIGKHDTVTRLFSLVSHGPDGACLDEVWLGRSVIRPLGSERIGKNC